MNAFYRAALAGLATVLLFALASPAQEPVLFPASKHGGGYMFSYYIPPAPGATPWHPCWSPDGQWIAFAMQGSIWKVDPKTGVAEEIASDSGYASSPTWSPDGKWIAYTSENDGKRIQLRMWNAATGQSHPLTDDDQMYLDPVFSPDGSRLAYVSTRPNGYFNIYVRAIRDGGWDGPPVAVTRDNEYRRERLYFGKWDMHTQPAWTPDGMELVFVTNRDVSLGSGDLWRAPAKEDGLREGRMIFREQTLYRTRPHVSPDGRRVVYASFAGGADQFNNLYVIPLAGGAPYKLTFGAYDHFHPRWSPGGERIAFVSNEDGPPQLRILETHGGALHRIRISERRWKRPMGRLRIRVVDESTGKPTPARTHGLAADGRFYAPAGAYVRYGASGRANFYTLGEDEIEVPPGKMTVEAVKGFEFQPAGLEVEIAAGRTAEAVLTLRRLAGLGTKGWYSGSTHVHMNYGGNLHHTPDLLAEQAAGEDLRVVNALVANKDNRVLDWQYFRGAREYPHGRQELGIHILFGEEYRPAFWGHSFLLGLRDHLISPFTGNYEATAIDTLVPINADIFRKAKAQGAVTGYVHPFGDADPVDSGSGPPTLPIDAALGGLDALEWSGPVRSEMPVWHKLLNNDIDLAPVGGEDSINDLHRLRTLGAIRTYAHVEGALSANAWLDGLRKGRTFFTTGPLLEFSIDGKLPGDIIRVPAGGRSVTMEATVRSAGALSKVAVYHKGGILRELPLNPDGRGAHFKERVTMTESDWFSLAAEGPNFRPFDISIALAATNAIRVYVGDGKIRDRASAEYFLRWIDKAQERVEQWPWWGGPSEKADILAHLEEGRRMYRQFIEEAH